MLAGQRLSLGVIFALGLSGMINSIQGADEDPSFWEKHKQKIVMGVTGVVTAGVLYWQYHNAFTSASDNQYPIGQACQALKGHSLTKGVVQGTLILIGQRYGSMGIEKMIDMTRLALAPSFQLPVQPQEITSILHSEQVLNMSPSIIQDLAKDLKDGCCDPEDFDSGFILYGPPGTGKTELAKALCLYLNIPLFYVKSSEFKSHWVNMSSNNLEKRLQEILSAFDGCALLFIDEIDEIAYSRDIYNSSEDQKVVSVLLQFIEGLKTKQDKKLIFFGATNRIKAIDSAFLDRMQLVKMNLPTSELRRTALEAYLSQYFPDQLFRDFIFSPELKEFIVKTSEGFSYRPLLSFVKSVYRHYVREKTITASIILEKLNQHFCKEK